MKIVQIYDPPMCCSTGVCGPNVNPDLISFAAMLSQLGNRGVTIERYNLGQQPMAFVQNPAVKAMLEAEGTEVLPLIFLGGELHMKGRYPTREERPVLFRAATEEPAEAS